MIYVTVSLCAIILALFLVRYDKFDQERWYIYLVVPALGAFGYYIAGPLEDWTHTQLGQRQYQVVYQAGVAATYEEAIKAVIVCGLAFWMRRDFNDPMDGLVYGALTGLGFGLGESTFYVRLTLQIDPHVSHPQLFGQEAIRLLLHFITGGITCFGVGLMRFRVPWWRVIWPAWSAMSVATHFVWDYACGLPSQGEAPSPLQRTIAIGLILGSTLLFGSAVCVGAMWSRVVHPPSDPANASLIGWPFTLFLQRHHDRRSGAVRK